MVSFIIGRAGSGKTHHAICQMKQAEGELILLVPEQYSHSSERILATLAGEQIFAKAEVLSFNRLADRIFMHAGGMANRVIDDGGRILLMHRALMSVRNELRVLKTAATKPEFLQSLIEITEEMKTCCVSPEKLFSVGDGQLADKLHDIALIATAYDGAFENGRIDPADKLKLACDAAVRGKFFAGKKVWVDGYTGFTPQEIELLRVIFAQSEKCTVTMCLNDDPEGENGAFAKAWDTYSRLARIAGKSEIIRLDGGARYKNESLAFLEKNLFLTGKTCENHDGIEIYTAQNSYDECKIVAARILELVRGGMRYRDIALVSRNFDEYAPTVAAVFDRFGIPFYENAKQAVLGQAPIAFVLNALRTIDDNFRYDDMAAYLKTGLCGVRRKSLDRLEHYLYTWHVEGKKWTQDVDFIESPSGRNVEITEEDKAELLFLNRLRARIREPLLNLRVEIKKNPTGQGFAEALFGFFEEVHLARRLEARAVLYRMRGEIDRAECYESLWQLLISSLENIARVLADARFTISEFTRIFSLMLSQYEIGMIPTTLDRVNVGGFERLGEATVKCAIILGAVDGRLPMHTGAKGILSDSERERLEDMGISLAGSAERRLNDEFRLIYTAFSIPSERLILTVPKISPDGSDARDSFVIARLFKLFPKLDKKTFDCPDAHAMAPCFDLAAMRGDSSWRAAAREYFARSSEYSEKLSLAAKNSKITRGPLHDKENIEAIFGKTIRLSASRTDSFNSCRYQYFLKYGLRLSPQRRARFDALEIGTFMHEILEFTLREVKARGGHRNVSLDEVLALSDIATERFVMEKLGGFEGKSARFCAQFKRLKSTVHAVVSNVHEELLESPFEPADFELKFSDRDGDLPALTVNGDGFTVKLEGFVDRVDTCTLDDTLYIRVVDYKTGNKNFKLEEVLNGLNMQLLLYLFTLCDAGEKRYHKKPEAAGVLYLAARDPIYNASGGEDDAHIARARNSEKVRRGLLLDKPELYGNEKFLPMRIKKDGEFDAKSSVASREQFAKISKRMNDILLSIGRELSAGETEANPYYKSVSESACDFCDMRGACHFDERAGDKKRYLFTTRMEDC